MDFRSVDWLKDPDSWPAWPICPVRRSRSSEMPQCGIVIDERLPDGRVRVVEVNMFALENGLLEPQLAGKPTFWYEDFDKLVQDGWEVD